MNSDKLHIDVIHSRRSVAPSVQNIKQGLRSSDKFNVYFHNFRIESGAISNANRYTLAGSIFVKGFLKNWRLKNESDAILIHKPLTPIDFPILERIFTAYENVIFSTYDATYLKLPRICDFIAKNSDGIISTSKEISDHYSVYCDNIGYIPPSVDVDLFKANESNLSDFSSLENCSLIAGWIGDARNHQDEIKLLKEIFTGISKDSGIGLRILPGGNITDELIKLRKEIDINVDIVEWVEKSEVPSVIQSFDIGLVPLARTEFNKARSSEKVREYMACGVPIFASNFGENRHLIEPEFGVLIDSPCQWINELEKANMNRYNLNEMGNSARGQAVSKYSTNVSGKKIEKFLTRTINK
jgi:glycosyltransferase involved in cell wall biosynthesis